VDPTVPSIHPLRTSTQPNSGKWKASAHRQPWSNYVKYLKRKRQLTTPTGGTNETTRIANYDINANDFATDKTLHAQVGYHPDLRGVFFIFYKRRERPRERERERERDNDKKQLLNVSDDQKRNIDYDNEQLQEPVL
jgi:hypothetical protein